MWGYLFAFAPVSVMLVLVMLNKSVLNVSDKKIT